MLYIMNWRGIEGALRGNSVKGNFRGGEFSEGNLRRGIFGGEFLKGNFQRGMFGGESSLR
jgi:hypothetical protein